MDKSELKPTEIRSLSPRLILFVLNDVVIPVVNVPVEPATVPPLILPVTSPVRSPVNDVATAVPVTVMPVLVVSKRFVAS